MNDCSILLATMDSLHRTKVMEELLVQRLLRKSRRVLETWERSERDWNQTMHEMTAYAMGAPRNSQQFQKLAQQGTFRMCMRERGSKFGAEGVLLGASGLLVGEFYDDYLLGLQEEFNYLVNKYGLRAMKAGEWNRSYSYPAGSPVLRVAQFAALVANPNYSFEAVVECRTLGDVESLFSAKVSEYWQKHYSPQGVAVTAPKSLGREKIVVMAINLVVPLQFAYGEVMRKDEIKMRAMELLESLPAEHNRIVRQWTGAEVPCVNAFDSQALIELQSFCDGSECKSCPLAKQIKRD